MPAVKGVADHEVSKHGGDADATVKQNAAVAGIARNPVVPFGGAREIVEGKRDSPGDGSGGMGRLGRTETIGSNEAEE